MIKKRVLLEKSMAMLQSFLSTRLNCSTFLISLGFLLGPLCLGGVLFLGFSFKHSGKTVRRCTVSDILLALVLGRVPSSLDYNILSTNFHRRARKSAECQWDKSNRLVILMFPINPPKFTTTKAARYITILDSIGRKGG